MMQMVSLPKQGNNPPVRLLAAFQDAFPTLSPDYIVQTPGRDMWVAATTEQTTLFTIYAPDVNGRVTFDWRSAKFRRTTLNRPLPRWARYPAGVIHMLCAAGMDLPGIHAVVAGDESPGPRYDHALGLTFAALWHELCGRPYTPEGLLDLVERVRREYIEG